MQQLLRLVTLLVLISTLTGCNLLTVIGGQEQALRQDIAAQGRTFQNFQIRGARTLRQQEIVLYSFVDERQLPVFGYALMARRGATWKIEQRRSFGGRPTPPLVAYDQDRINDALLIFGQVLQADVQAVEVTFDNGQTIRDEADDQVFAVVSPGASGLRELRVLGRNNTVLERYTQPRLTSG